MAVVRTALATDEGLAFAAHLRLIGELLTDLALEHLWHLTIDQDVVHIGSTIFLTSDHVVADISHERVLVINAALLDFFGLRCFLFIFFLLFFLPVLNGAFFDVLAELKADGEPFPAPLTFELEPSVLAH